MYFLLFSALLVVFGLLNYYLGLRVWQLLGSSLQFPDSRIYWFIFVVIVLGGILGTVGNKLFPARIRGGVYLVTAYWLAAMTYLILGFAAIDLLRLGFSATAVLFAGITGYPAPWLISPALTAALKVAEAAVPAATVVLLLYGTWNAGQLKTRCYELSIPKQAGRLSGLHIVMLCDTHFGPVNDRRQHRIIDAVNSLNPDIVLIPGDIIDDLDLFARQKIADAMRFIKTKYGVYACLGNHDYLSKDLLRHGRLMQESGIIVLRDSSFMVERSFYLVGREDSYRELTAKRKRREPHELLQELDRTLPVIMLDHQPLGLAAAKAAGVDLLLSGHTHRGQFFPFGLITRRIFETDHGYLNKDGLHVIVSCGAATWGPPLRIGTSSEVVSIKVNFKA